MRQMPLGNFFEEQYHFAEMFNRLKLSDPEIGLLTAAMIVCPGKSFTRMSPLPLNITLGFDLWPLLSNTSVRMAGLSLIMLFGTLTKVINFAEWDLEENCVDCGVVALIQQLLIIS